MRVAVLVAAAALALAGWGGGDTPESELPAARESVQITSPAFDEGQTIPKRFTCDGDDVSPPLAFRDVPPRARELARLRRPLPARGRRAAPLRLRPLCAVAPARDRRGRVGGRGARGDRGGRARARHAHCGVRALRLVTG